MGNSSPRVYEMGYTQVEFERVLNGAFTGSASPYQCQPDSNGAWRILHRSQPFEIAIELKPMPGRRLGAIDLPVLETRFHLVQTDPQQTSAFFDRFFKYFHKGGG